MTTIAQALRAALDLHGAGRLDEAEALYARILDADPDNPRALHLAATLYCQRGRLDVARGMLIRSAAGWPDHLGNHLTLAKIDLHRGDWSLAFDHCRRALALDPSHGETLTIAATAAVQQARRDDAITALGRAHRMAPTDRAVAERLGLLLHERGRARLEANRALDAANDLATAARLSSPDPELGYTLGAALLEAGRTAAADDLLRRLLAWFPAHGPLSHNAGLAAWRAGRAGDALTILRRATIAAPDDPGPCEAMAEILDTQGSTDAVDWSLRALSEKLRRSRVSGEELVLFADVGATSHPRNANIASYSLWGDLAVYCQGAIDNAKRVPELLPGWRCRFHHDDSVPPSVLAELRALGAELVAMPAGLAARQGTFWRFLVADDPSVDHFLCRDTDSLFTAGEVAAINAWMASDLPFIIMRDHVMHMDLVLAGLWGGRGGVLPKIKPEMERFFARASARYTDQFFLGAWLWPRIARRVMVFDGTHPSLGQPYPAVGPLNDADAVPHVGAKLLRLTHASAPRPPRDDGDIALAMGRDGVLAHPTSDPHITRALRELGEWRAAAMAPCLGLVKPGDVVLDLAPEFGAGVLAFAKAVGPSGRVMALTPPTPWRACLERTIAANAPPNVTVAADMPTCRVDLINAVIDRDGGEVVDQLLALAAQHHPMIQMRLDDTVAFPSLAQALLKRGYRLWWHIAPMFRANNRLGHATNIFPGLVTIDALALPPGVTANDPDLTPIDPAKIDWRAAAWRLRC